MGCQVNKHRMSSRDYYVNIGKPDCCRLLILHGATSLNFELGYIFWIMQRVKECSITTSTSTMHLIVYLLCALYRTAEL